MKKPKSPWLERSVFASPKDRNTQIGQNLKELFNERSDLATRSECLLDEEGEVVLAGLTRLLETSPARASQAAEAALVIAQFAIAEGRLVNITDPEGRDVESSGRLSGDRTVGDRLCADILAVRRIPATKGPFQSSSFRAGYQSAQVEDGGLRSFVDWYAAEGRELTHVSTLASRIVDTMVENASDLPEWQQLAASRLTFTMFRRFRERLLASGSSGAFEQYLLAALLNEEVSLSGSGRRVETKHVGANDLSSKAAGDIQIRNKQALESAIEVTAASWHTKLGQLETAARAGLRQATIAAPGVAGKMAADELAAIVDPFGERLGIDPAVIDLHALMDVLTARLSLHARAEAIHFLFQCVVRWHSREPELAVRIIQVLTELDLIASEGDHQPPEGSQDKQGVDKSIAEFQLKLGVDRIAAHPDLPIALRALADSLEAVADPV